MTNYTAPPNLTGIVLFRGDTLNVNKGGIATNTTITPGGIAEVNEGGLTNQTTVNSSGIENVFGGGKADNTTINGGGQVNVISGLADHTTINNNGELTVSNGVANLTTINGGTENVFAGGKSTFTTINNGGLENVFAKGVSDATTIHSGGAENVLGTANNTTIFAGGELTVLNNGTANGVIFIADAGTAHHAQLDLFSPTGLKGTITGWQVGDVIDFLNTSVTNASVASNILTVTYGSARDPHSATYFLANLQQNTHFQLQSDGEGGTELTLQPGVQSAVNEGAVPLIGVPVEDIGAIIAGSRINF